MERRTCRPCQPCKKGLLPAVLAVAGFILLLCCLPFWAFLAIVGLCLVVFAFWLLV